MTNPDKIKIIKATIPKHWKPNCPIGMASFFNRLPIVEDLNVIDQIDKDYEILNLKLKQK